MKNPENPADFHSHSIRGISLFLCLAVFAAGAYSLIRQPDWTGRIVIAIVLLIPLYVGVRCIIAPGKYRSWFCAGRVHWEYPTRIQGINDSCSITDVTALLATRRGTSGTNPGVVSYSLVLQDGTKKRIGLHCMGDPARFLERLRQENPAIEFQEANG